MIHMATCMAMAGMHACMLTRVQPWFLCIFVQIVSLQCTAIMYMHSALGVASCIMAEIEINLCNKKLGNIQGTINEMSVLIGWMFY